jgi:TRAP-type C4-dicarboxylate transport system permease small subunit
LLGAIGAFLRRRAENISVMLLITMFGALIAQVIFRYLINIPMGWTDELSLIMWTWLVLWGAAFVVRESDEIRFDLILASAPPLLRRGMILVSAAAIVILFLISLPAVIDYIGFMRVQRTAYFHIRFDWLFSIYTLFAIAAIVRYLWVGWRAIFSDERQAPVEKSVSGL